MGAPFATSTNDDGEEYRTEPAEVEEQDSRPGTDRESEDWWGEWWIPKAERLLETRPTGGE